VKPGDPVITPCGPGTVLTVRTRMVWTGEFRRRQGFIAVSLEDGSVRVFPAALVKPKLEVV